MKIDELIRSKRKTVALIIDANGRLVVRAPLRTPLAFIQEFVVSKHAWIESKRALVKKLPPPRPVHKFQEGECFWYLGKTYPLKIVAHTRRSLTLEEAFYLPKTTQKQSRLLFETWYKKQARQVISERVQWYAQKFGFSYQKLRLSSARTRWGSCSNRGTLSFTWRLVMAPLEVIDYVVVHELVHLRFPNHSKAFWGEVEKIYPVYRQMRAWLKKNGNQLTIE